MAFPKNNIKQKQKTKTHTQKKHSVIGVEHLHAVDMGGSMFVHTYGAYFGLAVSWMLNKPEAEGTKAAARNGSSKNSDMFAMIGTLFLWMYV